MATSNPLEKCTRTIGDPDKDLNYTITDTWDGFTCVSKCTWLGASYRCETDRLIWTAPKSAELVLPDYLVPIKESLTWDVPVYYEQRGGTLDIKQTIVLRQDYAIGKATIAIRKVLAPISELSFAIVSRGWRDLLRVTTGKHEPWNRVL